MDWKEKFGIWLSGIFAVPVIWFLVSWADILAHQFHGNPHGWNMFILLVDFYYRTH